LTVDPVSVDEPRLSDLVLGYRSEQTGDGALEGYHRTFQLGNLRIHPAVENIFTLGETVHVLAQVQGNASELGLKLAILNGEEILQERTTQPGTLQGGSSVEAFDLTGMTGGRYQVRGQLVDSEGTVLAEKSTPLQVSPRTAIARPWVHRRSFDASVPGLLALTLGEQLLTLKRFELAQRALEASVAANNPDLPVARWRLAGIYIGWREPDRALDLLLPLEDEFPNQYEVVAGLGFAYYFKDDFARAAEHLERAAAVRPPGTSLLNTLGECHQRLGDLEKAKRFLERSLELNPDQDAIKKKLDSMSP
jgi:tetratricopeptide (TPR) repeat protein